MCSTTKTETTTRAPWEEKDWLEAAEREVPALLRECACMGDGDSEHFYRAIERIIAVVEPGAKEVNGVLNKTACEISVESPAIMSHGGEILESTLDELAHEMIFLNLTAGYYLGLAMGMRVHSPSQSSPVR